MVQLTSKDCIQCNEVAEKGLGSEGVNNKITAEKIIAVKYSHTDADWSHLAKTNDLPTGLALLFFSPSGNVIYRYSGSTSSSNRYIQMIDAAKSKLDDEAAIETFEKAYESGSRNPALLAQLIDFRQNLGRETGVVLDDYVRSLSRDSLQSITQIQKIAGYAPILNTYADSVMRSNVDRFNEAWYRMDLQTRISINNNIINKTRKKAVDQKNKLLAYQVANFAAGVQNHMMEKTRSYNFQLVEYYRLTSDTANYLVFTKRLYEQYYMRISADSIKKIDSISRNQAFAPPSLDPSSSINPEGRGRIEYQRTMTFTPKAQFFGNDLNNAAFSVYKMNAPEMYTAAALKWSAKSLEFNETPAALDTYARLLYKTGQRDSALYYQQKAVALEKQRGQKADELETVLNKMKKKEARIDEYCCNEGNFK